MKLHVVITASATNASSKSKRKMILVHYAAEKNLKSEKIRA